MKNEKIAIDTRYGLDYDIFGCIMDETEYEKLKAGKIMFNATKSQFEEVDFEGKLVPDEGAANYDDAFARRLAAEGKFLDRGGYYENADNFYIDYDELQLSEMIETSFAVSRMDDGNYMAIVSLNDTDMVEALAKGFGELVED